MARARGCQLADAGLVPSSATTGTGASRCEPACISAQTATSPLRPRTACVPIGAKANVAATAAGRVVDEDCGFFVKPRRQVHGVAPRVDLGARADDVGVAA
jgi:hypothetical protein